MTATVPSALERAQQLKAARRAELAAEARREAEAAEVAHQVAEQRFNAELDAALKTQDAEWLLPLRSDTNAEPYRDSDGVTFRRVGFAIEGHRFVGASLVLDDHPATTDAPTWRLADAPAWIGTSSNGNSEYFATLADALICSEGDAASPIPF